MQAHYVFVDYDNTHMGNIGPLGEAGGKVRIKVFLGAHHSTVPLVLVRALQPLGADAEYIQIDHGRRNAIDFNIAFQLGELAIQHPDARFSILSNDPGFNEIIAGLRAKGINCARFADMESLFKALNQPAGAKEPVPARTEKVVTIKDPRQR